MNKLKRMTRIYSKMFLYPNVYRVEKRLKKSTIYMWIYMQLKIISIMSEHYVESIQMALSKEILHNVQT